MYAMYRPRSSLLRPVQFAAVAVTFDFLALYKVLT